MRDGQERKAFEILQQDISRKRSGRERFRRRLQLVEVCASTNKPNVAQPILDDLAAAAFAGAFAWLHATTGARQAQKTMATRKSRIQVVEGLFSRQVAGRRDRNMLYPFLKRAPDPELT